MNNNYNFFPFTHANIENEKVIKKTCTQVHKHYLISNQGNYYGPLITTHLKPSQQFKSFLLG